MNKRKNNCEFKEDRVVIKSICRQSIVNSCIQD